MVQVTLHSQSGLTSSFLVVVSMLRPALRPRVFVDPAASRSVLPASMSAPGCTVRLIRQVPAGESRCDDVAPVTSWEGICVILYFMRLLCYELVDL